MIIKTGYYGDVEYKKEDLFFFPDGLFGFPELKYYLPLCPNPEDDSLLLFQSTDQPDIAFVVINPVFLCPDYAPSLSPSELAYLKVSDSEELSYFVICVVRDNYLENTVNLKCPLAINPQTHTGMQIILEDSGYEYRHHLSSFTTIRQE